MSTGDAAERARWNPASHWYLIFLGYLAFGVVFRSNPLALNLAVTIGSVAVFLGLYVLSVTGRTGSGHWLPVVTSVLALAVVPVNGSATVYFVYAVAFAGAHLSRRATLHWIAIASALLLGSSFVSPVPLPYLFLATLPTLISLWIVGFAMLEQGDRDREHRVRNAHVEHLATLSERERIARDLHDLLGQTLTGVVVRAQLAQKLAGVDAERAATEMATVERMARDALTEVRATVSGWRQVSLDEEITAARDALAAAGVELVESRDADLVLGPSAETALAMALREAITNVVRHAGASRCTVGLRRAGERVVLEVADDGVGGGAREGNGLTGMRERITALGGEVQRRIRGGTLLVVSLPSAVAT